MTATATPLLKPEIRKSGTMYVGSSSGEKLNVDSDEENEKAQPKVEIDAG